MITLFDNFEGSSVNLRWSSATDNDVLLAPAVPAPVPVPTPPPLPPATTQTFSGNFTVTLNNDGSRTFTGTYR